MSISITNLGKHRDLKLNRDVRTFEFVESDSYSGVQTREFVTISETLDVGDQFSGEAGVWPANTLTRRSDLAKRFRALPPDKS